MKYRVSLPIASKQIGTAPRTASDPDRARQFIYQEFAVPSEQPLPGGIPIEDFVAELEADPEMAPLLREAAKTLAPLLDSGDTLRRLRLSRGLSQSKLATLAGTTQAYVARVELGTLDPGTDMLARLAAGLEMDELTVFQAVRAQRKAQESARVG